jgi:hypothetical protein
MPFDKQGIQCLKIVVCVLATKSKDLEGDISKKSKKYVSKNIGCNILVVG